MRDLVIADREGARGDRVQHLGPVLLAHGEEAGVAERPVEVHRRVDGRDAVFGQHQDVQAFGLGGSDEVAGGRVEVGERLRHRRMGGVRPMALHVVVEVRQVDERERRPVGADHVPRGLGDPPRRGDGRAGTPELEQRERPELLRERVAQSRRLGVAVGELAPVGLVDRARRRADLEAAGHVVPPEQVGAGEGRIAPLARPPRSSRRRRAGSTAARTRSPSGRGTASRCRRCRAGAAGARS